ncbi:hypothetical protein A5893_02250 [Pedobacter psychrophilus]|uniref:site-specific DNA-methyltransferase (adenine-specific) n=1 Tax=Pedobacter psychrophilus TaxID=1826909 RepID=A0A179DLR3_9SPHI|nr:TaqI-like C-terminal specificity domain-containing protein [Pedobacter psychrophilus]OAQ41961.1 hypothetical protein A5893_02250 [Pedobacter psychrophilus]
MVLSDIEARIKAKIEAVGTPLKNWDIQINYGIKTGFNEAFIIDGAKREELLKKSPEADEIIRPILRGKDIRKNNIEFGDKWLLFIPWHFPLHENPSITGSSNLAEQAFIAKYPAIYNHLLGFKDKLVKRNQAETGIRYEWYALQRCANTYYKEFDEEKLVYSEIVREPQFCLDFNKMIVNDTCFIMTGKKLKYILAALNSDLVLYFYKKFYAGGGLGEDGIRYKKIFLEKLPIPKVSHFDEQIIYDLVDLIYLESSIANENMKMIDELFLKYYQISEEEKSEIYFKSQQSL